ncbi:cullin-4A [Trichonephila clavipes]|nr:cullin-4A [Trichonephila clavipes]
MCNYNLTNKALISKRVAHPVQWLPTLTAVPLGLGSNPGEDMDICECIMPSWLGGILNSRRAASPLVRLGEERWEAPDHPQGVLSLNWGETELNPSVTCMVLKATANDRRHLAMMIFVGFDLAFADQVALVTTTTYLKEGSEVILVQGPLRTSYVSGVYFTALLIQIGC